MGKRETTSRGFRVFGRVTDHNDDGMRWRVQESSLAGEGPHVRLCCEGGVCVDFPGNGTGWHKHPAPPDRHQFPSPHLSYAEARKLRDALDAFLREADAGELAERTEVDGG